MSSIYLTDVEVCKWKLDLSSNFEKISNGIFLKKNFSPPMSTNSKYITFPDSFPALILELYDYFMFSQKFGVMEYGNL